MATAGAPATASRVAHAGRAGERRGLLLILVLAGLAMRTQLVSIGPLLPRISADLDIPHAVGGLLVTLPVLCMAAVAVPASIVADRFGAVAGVTLSLAVIAAAGAVRAVAPEPGLILVATVPIGLAIGLGGTLFPVVAKARLPDEPAAATSAYATGFVLGSTLAAAGAVPLADALGTWRGPLLAFAAATAALTLLWWLTFRGRSASVRRPVRLPRPPWRRPVAWLIVAIFGLQSLLFFCLVTWLPAFYVERGWTDQAAGFLVALLIGIGFPATLLVGPIADRWGSRRRYLVGAALLTLVGMIGINVEPEWGLAWVAIGGIGLGILFPLALTLPLDVAGDASQAGGYVGLMLAMGYLLSGTAPFVLGALRDMLGTFAASMPLVVVFSVTLLVVATLAAPQRLRSERESVPR